MDGRDQCTCGESDEGEHRHVEGDALQRPVLGKLNDGRGREQQESAGGPPEENDCGNCEDERQREHASAGLRIDRYGEALRERRRRGECGQADQFAATVRRGREGVTGRDQYTEARQTDRKDESGKPAGCDRL